MVRSTQNPCKRVCARVPRLHVAFCAPKGNLPTQTRSAACLQTVLDNALIAAS